MTSFSLNCIYAFGTDKKKLKGKNSSPWTVFLFVSRKTISNVKIRIEYNDFYVDNNYCSFKNCIFWIWKKERNGKKRFECIQRKREFV